MQALTERIGLHQVDHPNAPARDLVDVGRTDAAAGGPQLRLAPFTLFELVDQDVVRHDQVRPVGDEQVAALEAGGDQAVQLVDQGRRVDHHPVAQQVAGRRVEDPRRDQVQLEVPVRVDHGVARVVAAAVAHHQVGVARQVVDDPAFSLVAPLGADHGGHGHGRTQFSARGNAGNGTRGCTGPADRGHVQSRRAAGHLEPPEGAPQQRVQWPSSPPPPVGAVAASQVPERATFVASARFLPLDYLRVPYRLADGTAQATAIVRWIGTGWLRLPDRR